MRFALLSHVVLGAALVLSGCQPAAEEATEPEEPMAPEESLTDEQLLAGLTDAFAGAWAGGDASAIASLFVSEGDFVGPDGERSHGREAIQSRYAELFEGMYQGTTASIAQTSARFPSDDIAIVNGTYEITGLQDSDGNALTVNGLYTNVAVKDNGEWKIHCARPMVPLAAPAEN